MRVQPPLPSQSNSLFSDRAEGAPATEQFRPAPTGLEPSKEFRQRDQSAGKTHVHPKKPSSIAQPIRRERKTTRPR